MDRSSAGQPGHGTRRGMRAFRRPRYRGTSMKDIAEALGVRAPSLYNHVVVQAGDPVRDHGQGDGPGADRPGGGAGRGRGRVRAAPPGDRVAGAGLPALPGRGDRVQHRGAQPGGRPTGSPSWPSATSTRPGSGGSSSEGCRSGRFSTRTPQIAAFAVLEMGNSAKSWFRPVGRYPRHLRGQRVRGVRAARRGGGQPGPFGPLGQARPRLATRAASRDRDRRYAR